MKLLEITDATPRRAVAMMIADAMTESEREPYCFSMSHSIRGPKFAPCPIEYDWTHKDKVGITRRSNKGIVQQWLVKALLLDYTVERVSPKDFKADGGMRYSIEIAQSHARYAQMPKGDNDDDIPF